LDGINLDKVVRIVELTKKGMYRSEIVKELGVSHSTVYKYQKSFDLV